MHHIAALQIPQPDEDLDLVDRAERDDVLAAGCGWRRRLAIDLPGAVAALPAEGAVRKLRQRGLGGEFGQLAQRSIGARRKAVIRRLLADVEADDLRRLRDRQKLARRAAPVLLLETIDQE